MSTALYRRYRPESFAELIGQSHVTDPLMAALRGDRVNHAYLFSGPRGCGKTTSARILARCLNCAEGPTDTPCGVCPSCVELSRQGGGSLDVVEIDAASHNGVDDARDLRERAVFAPARDRFKIFILDEAHMVTPQGFNALLKIVEEPPPHVKFIFATTEPEKVIGTIRSRTHHYPFRLVPPAQLLEYVDQLAASEGVKVEPGVMPLVVRAGGGSVRDTLSLLDQLIAGSDADVVTYERAVALLGYTHGALLDDVVTALAQQDAAAAFQAVDRVIQTGQDPRRFVDDLLERLRDLIVVQATSDDASAVLRGIPQDDLERMHAQAAHFGPAQLSRAADIVNRALTEMTGATSPRLHLELMTARLLVPAADEPARGALARVEVLERRVGVDGPLPAAASTPAASAPAPAPVAPAAAPAPAPEPAPEPVAAAPVDIERMRQSWPAILDRIQQLKMSSWTVVYTALPAALDDDVLTLVFTNASDAAAFKQRGNPAEMVSEHVRQAILGELGLRVKFLVRVDSARAPRPDAAAAPTEQPADPEPSPAPKAAAGPAPSAAQATPEKQPDPEPAAPVTEWAVAAIPGAPAPSSVDAPPIDDEPPPADDEPEPEPEPPAPVHLTEIAGRQRYGEAVVREVLGARFIAEEPIAPTVVPQEAPPEPEGF
ncbi:DNA polymerase-3 subunit gamma/tau [Microcella putealis]|uniref:DNA polymerase III subunit gamma/tau n=1 Tax=Microcella putealis TaxID=337005 RepID=A0A4Q7LKB1_9MICO|nr:DNA polymerase III subunit gamma and tau [Microcella putealis]RZS55075.1 DNA polymerase-3 subunit gamma/tau [Microcella putealis]TQM19611.1 DNA polymerase-3 subunit gamma/tau [Microcella putealis]